MDLLPCKIRPHLVPFLFEQFEGKMASYQGVTVSSIRVLPSSSIAKFLYEISDYKKKRQKQDQFILHLTVNTKNGLSYHGMVYMDQKGIKEKLMLPEEKVRMFNNLLEDIFRIALTSYIKGCLFSGINLQKAFEHFSREYCLEENGLEIESLRQIYYREKKTNLLFRLQSKSANRVVNYC
jgi:hypothetical protein